MSEGSEQSGALASGRVDDEEDLGAAGFGPPALVPDDASVSCLPAIASDDQAAIENGFAALVDSIENLDESAAQALFYALRETIEGAYFELGGVLSKIRRKKWFAPHKNFKAFVQCELGKDYRSALHLVKIYEAAISLGLSYDDLEDVGWTKMRVLVGVLTRENKDHWLGLARQCSRNKLIELISAQATDEGASSSSRPRAAIRREGIDVKPAHLATIRQAISQSRTRFAAETDSRALELMCREFLDRPRQPAPLRSPDPPRRLDPSPSDLQRRLQEMSATTFAGVLGEALTKYDGRDLDRIWAMAIRTRQESLKRSGGSPGRTSK